MISRIFFVPIIFTKYKHFSNICTLNFSIILTQLHRMIEQRAICLIVNKLIQGINSSFEFDRVCKTFFDKIVVKKEKVIEFTSLVVNHAFSIFIFISIYV